MKNFQENIHIGVNFIKVAGSSHSTVDIFSEAFF